MKTFKEFLLMEEELKDYEGDINISFQKIREIPKEYRYDKVEGVFSCHNNQLTSLEGTPIEVGGNFFCYDNKLTSLKGAPEKVKGSFLCHNNEITSLKGSPEKVGGDFSCSDNKLTSLEGAPRGIGGGFDCDNNKLTSLKGIPKEIVLNFYCYNNPELFEVSHILSSNIEGKIYYTPKGNDDVSDILNKYKNNPRNLIKMLVELRKIDKRYC